MSVLNPGKNGKYYVEALINGTKVGGTAIYRDGEWYLSELSKHPLKEGVVRSWKETDDGETE